MFELFTAKLKNMKVDYPFSDMSTAAIHSCGNLNAEHAHLAPIYATSTFTLIAPSRG